MTSEERIAARMKRKEKSSTSLYISKSFTTKTIEISNGVDGSVAFLMAVRGELDDFYLYVREKFLEGRMQLTIERATPAPGLSFKVVPGLLNKFTLDKPLQIEAGDLVTVEIKLVAEEAINVSNKAHIAFSFCPKLEGVKIKKESLKELLCEVIPD
jgi:hypothetical protein